MLEQSKGVPSVLLYNYLIGKNIPQVLQDLWDFSKLEDQDMWTKNTNPVEVMDYIIRKMVNTMPKGYGVSLMGEAFRCRVILPDPPTTIFDVSWIDRMKRGRKVFMAMIGKVMQKGLATISDYNIDEYLYDTANESVEYYKGKPEEKEEVDLAKSIILEVQEETAFFNQCQHLAEMETVSKFKRLKLTQAQKDWFWCVHDLMGADSIDIISRDGFCSFDTGDGNADANIHFIMTLAGSHVESEIENYVNSLINEVGYSPGLEIAENEFNDANLLYEKLEELNERCD